MAYLILPSRRTRQPQGAVCIDWNNPLTRGLTYLVTAVGGNVYESVRRQFPTSYNGPTIRTSPQGLVAKVDSANQAFEFPASAAVSSAASICAIATYTAPAAEYGGIFTLTHSSDSGVDPYAAVSLKAGATSDRANFNFNANGVNYAVDSGSGGTYIGTPSGGDEEVFFGRFVSGAQTFHYSKNRSALISGTSSQTGSIQFGSGPRLVVGEDYRLGIRTAGRSVLVAALWNVALSDNEFIAFKANPWQLFTSDRKLYFGTSGGTGTTTERTVAARAKARGAATTATTRTTTAAGRVEARATATTTAIHAGTAAGRIKARGADTVAPLRTESAAGRIRAKATNTVEHIDAGAVSRNVAGKVRARGAAATLAIRATSIVGRVQARGADTVTSTRLSLAAGRVRGRAAVTAAPVIAGMVTTTAAGRLRARGSATATLTRIEAVAGRVTARGTDTANSIRAAVAAGRLRSRGRATSGPYVAPTLPLEIPPSTRTIDRDPARLGFSPISPTKPRLG